MRTDSAGTSWSSFWKSAGNFFINAGKVVGGGLIALAGAATTISLLPISFTMPGGGFATQVGFSTTMYGAFMVGSVFSSEINSDMQAIGWNPFNTSEQTVINSQKVSFYKGMPTIWSNQSNKRSGSFLGIWLSGTNTISEIKHEWGHGIQQGILGPLKYALLIGIPSYGEWSKNKWSNYYNSPWEITADMFGGTNNAGIRTQSEEARGIWYLVASALFGILTYLFLL